MAKITKEYIEAIKDSTFAHLHSLGVPKRLIEYLKLTASIERSIIVCSAINDIIHEYKSTDKNEKKVTELLINFLEYHFMKF